MVQTPPTGLRRRVAGIGWQQPLHTAVAQAGLPKYGDITLLVLIQSKQKHEENCLDPPSCYSF